MDKLKRFIDRCEKIGIKLECSSNFPWIYLDKINGQEVDEKFHSEYGFTIAFLPIRREEVPNGPRLVDVAETIKLIRKYTGRTKC